MRPVAMTVLILVGLASLTLIVSATVSGAYAYAASVAVVAAGGISIRRRFSSSRWLDVLLIAECAMVAFAILEGVHAVFAVLGMAIYVSAWNTGYRFSHFDRAPMEDRARARFVIRTLAYSLAAALAVTLLVAAFLYVHVSLTFRTGLAISVGALAALILFMQTAHTARHNDES